MQAGLNQLLEGLGLATASSLSPVSGGCINQCFRVEAGADTLFYKTHASPPPGFFKAEAQGLEALAETATVTTPAVIGVDNQGLLLEFRPPQPPDRQHWQQLAIQLASLHSQPFGSFGFESDNFCGLTPQPNPSSTDGIEFFAQQRLLWQARLAVDRQYLSAGDQRRVERLCDRLGELLPDQPPRLIHGDLWYGNLLFSGPDALLIDPATHRGWAEAELAMTLLFGGFPDSFYESYQQCQPLLPGWRQRAEIYNLYHLLNHLNLGGRSYLDSVRETLKRYD